MLSDSNSEFYRSDLLDFVFQDSNVEVIPTTVPSKYLHVHGSFMAECWMDYMAKETCFHMPCNSAPQDEDTEISFCPKVTSPCLLWFILYPMICKTLFCLYPLANTAHTYSGSAPQFQLCSLATSILIFMQDGQSS